MKKDKESLDEELKNLSPRLLDLREQGEGFRLPADYFDSLEDSVFQQIDAIGARRRPAAAAQKPGFWDFLARFARPRTALAFGSLLVAAAAAWWLLRPQPAPAPVVMPVAEIELTPEEAEAFLLANVQEFESDEIAALALASDEPPAAAPEPPAPTPKNKQKTNKKTVNELSPSELEHLLEDLSDEELEKLL